MKYPDFASMLPSQAKEAVVQFFYQKLVESRLNYHGDPMYKSVDALRDSEHFNDDYTSAKWLVYFDAAQRRYDSTHIKWMEGQQVCRKRLSDGQLIFPFQHELL